MSQVPLPRLPGMTFVDPRAPAKPRPQTLNYVNGYPVPDEKPVGLTGAPEAPAAPALPPLADEGLPEQMPAWVAYDRKVLRFYAYFKESVTESYEENHRVRKCVVYFYLEDESIHVAEPKQQNSGIPQGVFLKRHRIPAGAGFYGLGDLNVGIDVTFYDRTLHIYSCDPFTKKFLESSGIAVGADESIPDEPIENYRNSLKKVKSGGPPKPRNDDLTRFVEAKLGKPSNALNEDKLEKFLKNDRKVLRFFCVWDDRKSLYGDRRPYVLHYFLADDTVEILEVNEPNSGRDPFPVMLKRGPLPNQPLEVDALGPTKKYTHFTYSDLKVGSILKVFNRDFLIHDADEFTRNWYIENCGMKEEEFMPVDVTEEPAPIPQMELPPYNGFGSPLDTVQNCISLIAKPPKKDFHKLMNNEKKILRFVCQMVEDESHVLTTADMDRKFILSYFLADDTLGIYEPPARNSGIIGGKFLERGAILKPNSNSPYTASDLYVGLTLTIYNRAFTLTEADGYTYGYMEEHPELFPMSDFELVMDAVKSLGETKSDSLRTAFIEMDVDGSGFLNEEELDMALKKSNISLTKQQTITIIRKFDTSGDGKISIEEFFQAFGLSFDE